MQKLKLKGYLITLFVCYLIVVLVNLALSLCDVCDFSPWFSVYYPLLVILAYFVVDSLAAILCRLIPRHKINVESKLIKSFKFERKFYEALGVRYFKDRIPELGGAFTGFTKNELTGDDPEYYAQFIRETVLGEVTHLMCILFSIAVPFVFNAYVWNFAFPMFFVNFYFNILPIMVQRYNRPKLFSIYKRKLKQVEGVNHE